MTTPIRAQFAVELFLSSMRREWMALNPGSDKECPVKKIDDYDALGRQALTRSVIAAIKSTDASQDAVFARYEQRVREAREDARL